MADDIDDVAASLGITARPSTGEQSPVQGRIGLRIGSNLPKAQDRVPTVVDTTAQSLGITAKPGETTSARATVSQQPPSDIETAAREMAAQRGFQGAMVEGVPLAGPLFEKGVAASRAALQPITDPNAAPTFGERYGRQLQIQNEAHRQYAEAHPVLSTLGNVLGGSFSLGPIAGSTGAVGTAARMAFGLPNATRFGATIGGRLYTAMAGGAGINAADAALRGENPGAGAVMGAIGGVGGVLAGHTLGNIVEYLSRALKGAPGALGNVNQIGRGWLANTLANETPESLAAARARMGPQGFLADINPATTELAAGIANRPEPPASSAVGEAYRVRDAGQRATVDKALDTAFGGRVDIEQFKDMIAENRARAADPLYKQFRSMAVEPTEALQDVVTRADKAGAVDEAKYLAAVGGKPINLESPTPQTYDLIKRGLDSKIEQAYSGGNKTRAAALLNLKHELIDEVGKTPAGQVWNQARSEFADRSALLDQIQAGKDSFLGSRSGLSVDQLRHELQGLSGPELAARIVGARNAADEVMGATLNGDTTLRNRFLAPNNQEKLKLLIGDQRAKQLLDTLGQQQYLSGQAKYVNPRAGSPTAPRSAAMNALEAPPLPEWNPNVTQPLSFIPPSWLDALRPSTVLQGGRQAAYANARQQIVPGLLAQGPELNALLAAIRQEAGNRAGAASRGRAVGNLATAAVTGPVTQAVRRRANTSDNALIRSAQ
jgi:hypothetical protein